MLIGAVSGTNALMLQILTYRYGIQDDVKILVLHT